MMRRLYRVGSNHLPGQSNSFYRSGDRKCLAKWYGDSSAAHRWSSSLALAREQFFDSLEWQYSCVEGFWFVLEPYGGKNVEQQPVASREREREAKFETFREPTWWMREIYSSENDGDDDDDDDDSLPKRSTHIHTHTQRDLPSFFFHNSSAVPSVFFFFCFSIWLRDKHYIRSHKLWVARRNDLTFFYFIFFSKTGFLARFEIKFWPAGKRTRRRGRDVIWAISSWTARIKTFVEFCEKYMITSKWPQLLLELISIKESFDIFIQSDRSDDQYN